MDRNFSPQELRHRRLRHLAKPVVAAALVGALFWSLGARLRPGLAADRFRTATVERGSLEAVVVASATVKPAADRVLTSPVGARVLRVLKPTGSRVEAGDAVLELDLSTTRLALDQLQSRIDRLQARRRELVLELEAERSTTANRLEIKTLEREEAELEAEQSRRLHGDGLLSETVLRRVETRVRRLRIEQQGLEQDLVRSARSEDAKLSGVDSELGALRDEQAELRRQASLASTRVEAAGVLTWVLDEEGATVAPGDELARVADLGTYRVEAVVSDIHASSLAVGLTVRLPLERTRGLDAGPFLVGRIERVLPAVEEGTVRFWVELEGDAAQQTELRPNLRLDAVVVLQRKEEVLKLAKGPFAAGPGAQDVFVLSADGTVAVRRTVRLGLSGYEAWEVVEGLAPGDEVVISDMSEFKNLDRWSVRR